MPVLDSNQSYTFRSYFDLKIDPIDLAEFFGYRFERTVLTLNTSDIEVQGLELLRSEITDALTRLVSMNEQAKREMMVAPVIRKVSQLADSLIRIEYPVNVTTQLRGNVDYLLSVDNLTQLVVIEAKQDDLDYGFSQLVSELIALDQWERSPSVKAQPVLIGAVTIGTLWQFGKLDRQEHSIQQDISGYRLPQELEVIIQILVQCLRPNPNNTGASNANSQ